MAYKNLPRLRFREFSGEWKMGHLSDIGTVKMNKRIHKKDTKMVGEVPFFKIGTFGKKPDAFIDRDKFIELKKRYPYPSKGDILISASGTLGRTVVYDGSDEYFQDSNIIWLDLNKKAMINSFLLQFYKQHVWNSEGTTIKRLYNKDIYNTEVNYPFINEQQKIGSFFAKQDKLIELQTQKVDQLKKQKRGYLQKMFPQDGETVPRLRFSGFSGEWKEVTLNDIGKIVTGNTPTKKDKNNYGESYVWITPSDINEESTYLYDSKTKLTKKGKELSRVIPKNSLMVTCIASIGKNALSGKEVSINQQINAVIPYDIYNSYFLLSLSSEWSNEMKKKTSNASLKIINRSEFSRLKTLVPSLDEQKIIGDFFAKLDKLIEEQSNKLDQLKQQKKAYLQKMFI